MQRLMLDGMQERAWAAGGILNSKADASYRHGATVPCCPHREATSRVRTSEGNVRAVMIEQREQGPMCGLGKLRQD